MFMLYVLVFAIVMLFVFLIHIARAPYDELIEQGYTDKQINQIKNLFHTNKTK